MTLKSGTGQACAACKFQRRRCTAECLLAPYFPADQPKMFQNVHRLFGVKHVQNLLKELSPDQKPLAISSIKFHAAMRDKHPVLGCVAEIQYLERQIQLAEDELSTVLHHLDYYRRQQQQQQQQREISSMEDRFVSQLQLGVGPPVNATAPPPPPPPLHIAHHLDNNHNNNNSNDNNNQTAQYNALITADYNDIHMDSHSPRENHHHHHHNDDVVVDDCFWMQQTYNYDDVDNSNDEGTSMIVQSELSLSQNLPITQQETGHDCNEMHQFLDSIDDRQSFNGSSFESRQSIEQMAENELKSAAACFGLTSVN